MRQYELVVVLHPDLEIDVDTPISKIEKLIGNTKGTITKRDNWGKKRLAYPIKKHSFGVYVFFELELEPEAVRSIEASLLITEEVIRFMLVNRIATPPTVPAKSDAPKSDNREVTAVEAA